MGTLMNVALIIVGGGLGLGFKNHLKPQLQKTLMQATGVAVIFLAIAGVLGKMMAVDHNQLQSGHSFLLIISMALGAVLGELCQIEARIEQFGDFLKRKTGSQGDSQFVDGFVTATCTVCVGAMAVVGSIQDGIYGDASILLAKGVLDLIIIAILSASLGRGAIFSAIPVAVFQGGVTLLAALAGNFLSSQAVDGIALVGNAIIFCVGTNLAFDTKVKVANLLPALLIAVIWNSFAG